MKKKTSKRHIETAQLRASAYGDAVRDILRTDGVFHMIGNERRPDAVWQWDGVYWKKLPIDSVAHEDAIFDERPGQQPRESEETDTMVAVG
jgi:hypothetical protein